MRRVVRFFRGLWWSRQRELDVELLWPACKRYAPTLDHARAAFMVHCASSPAWAEHFGDALPTVVGAIT